MNFKNSRFPKRPLELLSVQEMDELSTPGNVDERQEVEPEDIIPILDVSSSLPNRAKKIQVGRLVDKLVGDNFADKELSNLTDGEQARFNLGLGDLATEDNVIRPLLVNHFERSIPLNLVEEGVTLSDNENSVSNQTSNFLNALLKANSEGRDIISPGGYIELDPVLINSPNMSFHFVGNPVNDTVLIATQDLSDNGNTILEINHTNEEIAPGTMTLSADVFPNQDRINLSGAGNLQPGMIIQWASNVEWPHDGRGRWMKGEIHKITRDLGGGSFEIDGATWDFYDISAETITVRAWWPGKVTLANLSLFMPSNSTGISNTGLRIARMNEPVIDGLKMEGMTSTGSWLRQNWKGNYRNIDLTKIGRDGEVGYGMSLTGEVASRVTNLSGRSCRRILDLSSLANTDSSPSRLVTVRDFYCNGSGTEANGDEFWPNGTVPNFGIGTHGPAEQCKFVNGFITNVNDGITVRGRDISVSEVEFRGNIQKCIQASYGTGLKVRDCIYEGNDYPKKEEVEDKANVFVQFGGDTNFGPWDYTKTSSIQNCVVNGVKEAFIRFAQVRDVQNLNVQGNSVLLRPDTGEAAYMFDSPNGSVEIRSGQIGPNSLNRLSGNGAIHQYDPNVIVGNVEALDDGVELGGGQYEINIPDDTAKRIRSVGRSGRVNLGIRSNDGTVRGNVQVVQGATSLVDLGNIGSGLAGSNSGSLNGTTGNDGDFTISLTPSGDLFVENRTGSTLQVNIQVT